MVRYSKQDALSKEEREQLIQACETDKETLVIKGLLYSGMRAGEFANMKAIWIDWQKEVINIPRKDGEWTPKTRTGARQIPMNFELKKLLYDYFQTCDKIGIHRSTLHRIVLRVGSRLKPFKKVYPHSLRATFASMMADNGMPAATIQAIMGWSKLETANNYVRSREALQTFRDKMGGVR